MIDTIIFDIGKVLTTVSWNRTLDKLDIPSEAHDDIIRATIGAAIWNDFDQGRDINEVLSGCISIAPNREKEIRKLFDNLHLIVEVCDYASEWIKSFRDRGFSTYILSNFPREAYIACEDMFDFLKYADGALVSYRIKEIKPYPAIYNKLISMYDIIPENAIFIDDKPENIETAVKLGIHGVVFTSKEQADRDVEQIIAASR